MVVARPTLGAPSPGGGGARLVPLGHAHATRRAVAASAGYMPTPGDSVLFWALIELLGLAGTLRKLWLGTR